MYSWDWVVEEGVNYDGGVAIEMYVRCLLKNGRMIVASIIYSVPLGENSSAGRTGCHTTLSLNSKTVNDESGRFPTGTCIESLKWT
jgi:hypothetical protein